jgi:hypothetical protein
MKSVFGRFRHGLLFFMVALLLSSTATVPSASADPAPATDAGASRRQVASLWHFGGPTVHAAAERALAGTDADLAAFLTNELPRAKSTDERISVDRMLTAGGSTVKTAAQQALDSADSTALTSFLQTGWQVPWGHDQRIRVDQILAAGDTEVRKAAQAALDADTPEALQTFLQSGWQTPYNNDQRIRLNQILAGGGPEVRTAAQRALDTGTPEAYTQFLDHDRAIAEARDQETTTVAQLAAAAKDAGAEAARETQSAKDASARAVREAELAKQAALAAAQASLDAKGNADLAAAAAAQAATAANNAAAAAREAVSAANAASSAARVAAGAASRAASAASKAGQAAARAYSAASAAATDAGRASDARKAAEDARIIAGGALQAAAAAQAAGDAANNAKGAADAAGSAGSHAADAAQAAANAAANASNAGANAAKARQAAATARANADRATRAAHAAGVFAAVAANAAYTARDAANRAASDATAAAAAADDAAAHAGNAADAANQATLHANAATQAAQAATTAANQAQQVYNAARAADAERVAIETEQSDQTALAASTAADQLSIADQWNATQAELRTAETNRLITEAGAAGTTPALALADARKAAIALSTDGGPWTQAASYAALTGTDAEAMQFVRTGIALAAGQDDRTTLRNLADTGTTGFRNSANTALAGTDADVQTFLHNQNYPTRETDDRIAVNQVLAAAQLSGGTVVQKAAQQALDAGNDTALRQFLRIKQYGAAVNDERISANQILAAATSGPELKGAAQIALDGTAGMVHQFLAVGRYTAAQRDQDSATHVAEIAAYLAQAAQAASTASQNANEAQATAATARGAADAAAGYAQQARNDFNQASTYAAQAHQSALQAQDSATKAAQSVATAQSAAAAAQQSAHDATRSATWATASEHQAARFASDAYVSAHDAYISAHNAGLDAVAAAEAAQHAVTDATQKVNDARAAEALRQADLCEQYKQPTPNIYADCMHLITASDFEKGTQMLQNGSMCELLYQHGSQIHSACLFDVLSPSFKIDQNLVLLKGSLLAATAFLTGLLAIELGGLCAAFEPCGLLAMSALPEGTAFTSWMAVAGFDALMTARIEAMIERAFVQSTAEDARLARAAAGLWRTCFPNSFTGDTPVLLDGGGSKPIRDVRVGDMVVATDPAHDRTAPKPVTQLITGHGVKHMVNVSITAADGPSVVEATANHPFWVNNTRTWVNAGDLEAGDHLRIADGTQAQVTGTLAHDETTSVYNLTVQDLHTYYVLAGTTPVLVHNADCEDIALGLRQTESNDYELAEFSLKTEAAMYNEWGDAKHWYEYLHDFLNDGKTRIHFNLNGIDDPVALADIGAGEDPALSGHVTAWELDQIRRTPAAWPRVTFYRDGKPEPREKFPFK